MAKRPSTKSPDNLPPILRQPIFIELETGIGLWQTRLFTKAELLEQLLRKVEERLAALLNHYNIPIETEDKWKILSCRLAEQLGLMDLTTEQPQIGRPPISPMENRILIERMNTILGEGSFSCIEDAAKKLKTSFQRLTAKTLANRYNAEKAKNRMSLSTTLTADYPKAIGQKLQSLRSKKVKLRSQQGPAAAKAQESGTRQTSKRREQQKESLAALNSWEKFWLRSLKSLQAFEKDGVSSFARKLD